MHMYKTRVVRGDNYGWQIERQRLGQWERIPFVFRTREEARGQMYYYGQF